MFWGESITWLFGNPNGLYMAIDYLCDSGEKHHFNLGSGFAWALGMRSQEKKALAMDRRAISPLRQSGDG